MEERTSTTVCYRHPDRATRLSCSECGKPICAECSSDAAVGQKCPECAAPSGRHRVVTSRQAFAGPSFRTTPVTFSIIAVAVVIHLFSFTMNGIELARFRFDWGLYNPAVATGEWWRALTAAFLHANLTHILFNMWALYIFGPRLERQAGPVAFGLMYAASAVGGAAASFALGNPDGLSIGASGAIFGLFGAWVFIGIRLRHTPGGRALLNQLLFLLVLNAALPLIVRNIDWLAHVGGFVTGFAIATAWGAAAAGKPNSRAIRSAIAAGALAIGLMLILVL